MNGGYGHWPRDRVLVATSATELKVNFYVMCSRPYCIMIKKQTYTVIVGHRFTDCDMMTMHYGYHSYAAYVRRYAEKWRPYLTVTMVTT